MIELASNLDRPNQVLVVDNEQAVLQEVADTLGTEGFTCHVATTLEEAQTRYFNEPSIEIVLCDVGLDGESGLDLPLILRNSIVGRVPSFIFFTAHNELDVVIDAMRAGATDFLTKPCTRMDLVNAIKRAARLQTDTRKNIEEAFRTVSRYAKIVREGDAHEPRSKKRLDADRSRTTTYRTVGGPNAAPPVPENIAKVLDIRRNILRKASAVAFWNVETDILLELLAARDEGREVSATKISLTVHLPQTTVLRRIEHLEESGLVTRIRDDEDKRRMILRITDAGEQMIARFAADFGGLILDNGKSAGTGDRPDRATGAENGQH